MSSSLSERPGVYSDLETSGVRSASGKGRAAGLLAWSLQAAPGLYTVAGKAAAASLLGSGTPAYSLCALLLDNGASSVICSVYGDEGDFAPAAARFETEENAYVLACGSGEYAVQAALLSAAVSASSQRREKLCVFGMESPAVAALVERAALFNSERAVLIGASGDGVTLAAAAAGAICAQTDPAQPLVDVRLTGVSESGMYTDADFDALIVGGVTPVEGIGGAVTVSRAVTTRTMTGSVSDTSFRELNTILIADEVIPGIRSSLTALFRRAKNTAKTRETIRTQVILELESRVEKEIIQEYGEVTAEADSADPTLCLVAFDFTVAHGLNRVHLSAVLTV